MTYDPPQAADGPPLLDVDGLAAVFKTLSRPQRLQIVLRLAGGECDVKTLEGLVKIPQPQVSHHLGILRATNLVAARRVSRQILYRLGGSAAGADYVTIDVAGSRIRFGYNPAPAPPRPPDSEA
jgi:DNA-binding transcriptional ArsR family regulator